MPDGYYLTPERYRQFLDLLNSNGQITPAPRGRGNEGSVDHQEMHTTELYIAIPPSGGIPAMEGEDIEDFDLGYETCPVYKMLFDGTTKKLVVINKQDKIIHNITKSVIPGDKPILVHRDKFGIWIASVGGGSLIQTVKITAKSGTGASAVYSGVKVIQTAPNTWDEVTVDSAPVVVTNIIRLPSYPIPPDITTDGNTYIDIRPDPDLPNYYRTITAVGSRFEVDIIFPKQFEIDPDTCLANVSETETWKLQGFDLKVIAPPP